VNVRMTCKGYKYSPTHTGDSRPLHGCVPSHTGDSRAYFNASSNVFSFSGDTHMNVRVSRHSVAVSIRANRHAHNCFRIRLLLAPLRVIGVPHAQG
jgi:hypothetical protein